MVNSIPSLLNRESSQPLVKQQSASLDTRNPAVIIKTHENLRKVFAYFLPNIPKNAEALKGRLTVFNAQVRVKEGQVFYKNVAVTGKQAEAFRVINQILTLLMRQFKVVADSVNKVSSAEFAAVREASAAASAAAAASPASPKKSRPLSSLGLGLVSHLTNEQSTLKLPPHYFHGLSTLAMGPGNPHLASCSATPMGSPFSSLQNSPASSLHSTPHGTPSRRSDKVRQPRSGSSVTPKKLRYHLLGDMKGDHQKDLSASQNPLSRLIHRFNDLDLERGEEDASDLAENLVNTEADLLSIPSDIWEEIFLYESFASWQELVTFSKSIASFHRLLTPAFLKKVLERNPEILKTLPNSTSLSHLISFTHLSPSQLEETPTATMTDQNLAIIALYGQRLTKISLCGAAFTLEGFTKLLENCPNLREIEFVHVGGADFDSFIHVLTAYASGIRKIKIVDCPTMTDKSLFALSYLSELTSFEYWNSLGHSHLSDHGFLCFLSACENLETFSLSGCPLVTQLSLIHLFRANPRVSQAAAAEPQEDFSKIRHLGISYCGLINEEFFNVVALRCPDLRSLELGFSLSQCRENLLQKSEGLKNLFTHCRELADVKMSDCLYLTEDVATALVKSEGNQKLERLEIYSSPNLSLNFYKSLGNCSKLQVLKLEPLDPARPGFAPLLEQELIHLTQGTAPLTSLSLFNCFLDTEKYFALIKSRPNLEEVKLHQCSFPSLTEKNHFAELLEILGAHCPQLVSLEIKDNTFSMKDFISDEHLHLLGEGCHKLNRLILNFAPAHQQLTSRSLRSLANSVPQLTHLTLSGLNLVSSNSEEFSNNQHAAAAIAQPPISAPDNGPADFPFAEEMRSHDEIYEDIVFFTEKCFSIIHLGIPFSRIDKKEMLLLINQYKRQLLSLDIENVDWIFTKSGFKSLLDLRKTLQYLNVKGSIPAGQLSKILKQFPALRFAEMDYNKAIIDNAKISYQISSNQHVHLESVDSQVIVSSQPRFNLPLSRSKSA